MLTNAGRAYTPVVVVDGMEWLERTCLRGVAAAWGCTLDCEALAVTSWKDRTCVVSARDVAWTSRQGCDAARCAKCEIAVE